MQLQLGVFSQKIFLEKQIILAENANWYSCTYYLPSGLEAHVYIFISMIFSNADAPVVEMKKEIREAIRKKIFE